MKSDQDTRAASWASVELLEEEAQAFHGSLSEVLERIAPLTATPKGLSGEEHLRRLAAAVNAAAVREGITTLQRLLALLLFYGWTDDMSGSAARQAAQPAIVDTVQG